MCLRTSLKTEQLCNIQDLEFNKTVTTFITVWAATVYRPWQAHDWLPSHLNNWHHS